MFFLITVDTSIQIQFFDRSILRDRACSFLGEIHYFDIYLLWRTNPDSQITQPFFREARPHCPLAMRPSPGAPPQRRQRSVMGWRRIELTNASRPVARCPSLACSSPGSRVRIDRSRRCWRSWWLMSMPASALCARCWHRREKLEGYNAFDITLLRFSNRVLLPPTLPPSCA